MQSRVTVMAKKTVYAWDSAVWIAWLRKEQDKDLRGVASVVHELVNHESVLLISSICDVEVIDLDPSDSTFEVYSLLKKLPYVQVVDVHSRVIEKANTIRTRIKHENNSRARNKLKLPKAADAIQLATAVLQKVDAMHTFDNDLLNLDGTPIAEGGKIVKPQTLSGQLRIDVNDEAVSLHGMTPEDALRKALGAKLPESVSKAEEAAERDEKKSRKKD